MSDKVRKKIFLSYGRGDASALAEQLATGLAGHGMMDFQHYEVWRDRPEIIAGQPWADQIADAVNKTDAFLAILSPLSVRRGPEGNLLGDSVCLDEISFARYGARKPIVPIMAILCQPPLDLFRLHYVDFTKWQDEAHYRNALAELLASLEDAFAGRPRYRHLIDRLDPMDFGQLIGSLSSGFTGRTWLFEKIDDWLKAPAEPIFLILGKPGTGKSAIAAELVRRDPDGRIMAVHLCRPGSSETWKPGRFVRSIAGMIAAHHPGFEALLELVPYRDRLSIQAAEEDPVAALEQGILAALERAGPPQGCLPKLLVIDALDETLADGHGGALVSLLAQEAERFPTWLKIVTTSRDEAPVQNAFARLRHHSLDALDPLNRSDLEAYVAARVADPTLATLLRDAGVDLAEATRQLTAVADGNFLYAQRALEGLSTGVLKPDEIGKLPPGLGSQYYLFFERQFKQTGTWADVKPIFQVLVAAEGPIGRDDMAAATGLSVPSLDDALNTIASYVREARGAAHEPTVEPFHRSLVDWLTLAGGGRHAFAIDATDGHRCLAKGLLARYRQDRFSLSSYAVVHLPNHLAAAAAAVNGETRAGLQHDLADVVLDTVVQEMRRDDPFGMDAALRRAIAVTSGGPPEGSVSSALRTGLGWHAFRRERLDAARLFELASSGKLAEMERDLLLFRADQRWADAARLAAALLARNVDPLGSDALRHRARTHSVLDERVDAVFEGRKADYIRLDRGVLPSQVQDILDETGGQNEEPVNPSMLWDQAAPPPGSGPDPEGTRYIAEFHAPVLVAFCEQNSVDGDRALRDYIRLNAANAYRVYRNGALWEIVLAVSRHCDPNWIEQMLPPIVAAALSGDDRDIDIAMHITCTALNPARRPDLDAMTTDAMKAAAAAIELKSNRRGVGDPWAEHRRRLAALAETWALRLQHPRPDLLNLATDLPRAFAGFQAPACLTLAESAALSGAGDGEIRCMLDRAWEAAHNVQDLVFCARTTSRVAALIEDWWPGGVPSAAALAALLRRFAEDPQQAEFAALHRVGESYEHRQRVMPTSRLPDWFEEARTLADISRIYQWPVSAFGKLNPEITESDQPLPDGTRVRVPDPEWAPMLGAFLSCLVLRTPELEPTERLRFLLRIVPTAAPAITPLATVLSRVLLSGIAADLAAVPEVEQALRHYLGRVSPMAA